VESRATVVIPLDDRILFVSSLNRADFSSWLSEVAQTLDPISRSQLLAGGSGLGGGGLLAPSVSGTAPAYDGGGWRALRSLGIGFLVPWIIVLSFPRGQKITPAKTVLRLDRHSIGLKDWLGRSKLHSSDNYWS
jgi:hypothetical protein